MNSPTPLQLPPIGLGTWMLKSRNAEYSVFEGLKMGYTFVDTAQAYENEAAVGQGLSRAFETLSLSRKNVIIATKIHPMRLHHRLVYRSALKSRKKLGIDTIDILYVHYPAFKLGYSHTKTLKIFDKLIDEGIINHIGLSNFTISMLKDAQEACKHPIFAHQVEHHPYLPQANMLSYLKEQEIQMISYSPLARGNIIKDSVLQSIGEHHKTSPAQISLAWLMHKGAIPIPKASSIEHLRDNFNATQITLTADEIQQIDAISYRERYVYPPVVSPKQWKSEKI